MPKFMLEIDEKTYQTAGSKFINTGISNYTKADVGKSFYLPIECSGLDWDQLNKSMKIDTTVIDGINKEHKEKISFGVDEKGIWKGKALYKNVSGKDMPMEMGKDKKMHPAPDTDDIDGKQAVGVWVVQEGDKGGDPNAGKVIYPKLQDIMPKGTKAPAAGTSGSLGI